MPYYCTVPRCTSMAGKAKNVSFHQFPRDEDMAKLWNKILKRGKPYTKYSKVCSLHFRPEDYKLTGMGQWRTLRKNAIPSQNLPSESPAPYHKRDSGAWAPSPPAFDTTLQQQMAQAIYVRTMLAMQAGGVTTAALNLEQQLPSPDEVDKVSQSSQFAYTLSQIEDLLKKEPIPSTFNSSLENPPEMDNQIYRCSECSKCFKDPDVFILHQRTHNARNKENCAGNIQTLKDNPILANLLKSIPIQNGDTNVMSIENQIMTALAANMENCLRNLTTIMSGRAIDGNTDDSIDDGNTGDSIDDGNTGESIDNEYSEGNCDIEIKSKDSLVIDEEDS